MPPAAGGGGPAWWVWLLVVLGVAGVTALVMAFAVFPHLSNTAATTTPTASATASPHPTATATATATATEQPTPAPPTAAPGPPNSAPASDPNGPVTVARYLFGTSGEGCQPQNADYTGCPVTSDLASALHRFATTAPADPWCRCQNVYAGVTWTRDDSQLPAGYQGNPDYAAVDVHLTFGPSSTEDMILVFTKQGGWWVVADTWCGNPQNRMTAAAPGPCS